jgi:adenylate cyclase class IV
MQAKEIEAKFMDVDIKDIRKKIKEHGGHKIHKMVMYKRYVFHLLDKTKKGYVRIRQEYNKVTMTVKTYDINSKYANESEIILGSTLEEARDFLLNLGYELSTYHETLREKWVIDGCSELCIDTIPGIPTYIELECKNEKNIKKIAKLFGFKFADAQFGAYDKQYVDYYGMTKDDINLTIPSLTFKNIDKELKNYIKKNHNLINKIKKDQLQLIKLLHI